MGALRQAAARRGGILLAGLGALAVAVAPAAAQTGLEVAYNGRAFTQAAVRQGAVVYVPLADLAKALGGAVTVTAAGIPNLKLGRGLEPPSVTAPPQDLVLAPTDLPPGYRSAGASLTYAQWAGPALAAPAQAATWGWLGAYRVTLTVGSASLLRPGAPVSVVSVAASFGSAGGAAQAFAAALARGGAELPPGLQPVDPGYLGTPAQEGAVFHGTLPVGHGRHAQVYAALLRQDNVVATVVETGPADFTLLGAWPAFMSAAGAARGVAP